MTIKERSYVGDLVHSYFNMDLVSENVANLPLTKQNASFSTVVA